MLEKIEQEIKHSPEGCVKIQQKKGKIYYYHQYKDHTTGKMTKRYILRKEENLAKALAQKGYYIKIKPLLEKELHALEVFEKNYDEKTCDDLYESLLEERKHLVEPVCVTAQEQLRRWQAENYDPYRRYSENLKFETENGEMVRSKSELIIANILHRNRKYLLYKYERPLELQTNGSLVVIHPDFTILNIRTGKMFYWEHAGRMDDPRYSNDFVQKMNLYMENQLFQGEAVVVTYETMTNPLNIHNVNRIVENLIDKR